ncbi:MAG: hypothetical protein CMH59_16355, partial [Myxococcales bacterium]|nr:hypothetical protein [Myxococcales bacterium]
MDERALLELGREVAAEQDAALEERDDLRAVRARLLRRRARRWHVGRWVAAATLAAAAAGALISWGTRPAPPIGFEVAGEPGREGAWMAADETPRELRFSDGSRVELAPGAGLRVSALGPEGARLDLQRGSARVEVRHRSEDTRWAVHAGPFEVRVVGTAFDVSWDGERFALALEEGRVRISGPTLNERVVDAGETVRVALSERRVEIVQAEPAPAEPRTANARGAEPEPAPRVEERTDAERAEAPRPTPRRRARIDWRRLAREGRHADALEVADWDRVLATGGPEDLVLLGNAARLFGADAPPPAFWQLPCNASHLYLRAF